MNFQHLVGQRDHQRKTSCVWNVLNLIYTIQQKKTCTSVCGWMIDWDFINRNQRWDLSDYSLTLKTSVFFFNEKKTWSDQKYCSRWLTWNCGGSMLKIHFMINWKWKSYAGNWWNEPNYHEISIFSEVFWCLISIWSSTR